ncbi:3'-5' exonuclease [Yinghuangia seranimata]|uniref:3'-5' exonuclease n=1 Tax=Yinghuangia seranimata TaxID=408067 RepID=UPI00248B6178|nr:3'-5' exonuclease [Yinghuangia seranimata]MDI2126278.1 3'-5' exonuclease [Yinghuangia seranimata]
MPGPRSAAGAPRPIDTPAGRVGAIAVRDLEFAVVDLETTGFSPGRGDRIVEIGVVRIAGDGRVLREWTTLVDPGRGVGATQVHRITEADVAGAPRFVDIAGELAGLLAGAVVVAHNAAFEQRFLEAEFAAAGVAMPMVPALCTMRLAKATALPVADSKLGTCCAYFGLEFPDAHAALADARVTARLLPLLLREAGAAALTLAVPPARAPEYPAYTGVLRPRRGFEADPARGLGKTM